MQGVAEVGVSISKEHISVAHRLPPRKTGPGILTAELVRQNTKQQIIVEKKR